MIPQSELYPLGQRLLNRYPLPTRTQTAGSNYNYEALPAQVENLAAASRDPHRLPAQLEAAAELEIFGPACAQITSPGTLPGFTDVNTPFPYITNYAATVNYTISPTTFLEGM